MFTSHCDVHSGILSGWHKDDGMTTMEGGYFGRPMYNNPDCSVYKVAIYLQDHTQNKTGLTVRSGSHKYESLVQGDEVYLPTSVGDIVVFDVRLTHVGQQYIVPVIWLNSQIILLQKIFNKLVGIKNSKIITLFKKNYDRIFFQEKISIFFTYGLPNEYTKVFSQNNMKRQVMQNKKKDIFVSEKLRSKLIEENVVLAEDYFLDLV
ncbi:MAG: hypothetical protein WCD18_28060 [Thermosynechococcaceae cyanobacterium]